MSSELNQVPHTLQPSSNPFPRFGAVVRRLPDEEVQKEARLYEQLGTLLSTLATTNSLFDANKVASVADALKVYAKHAHDPEKECQLAEIRLRAKRRVGELSAMLPTANGVNLPNVGPKWIGKLETLRAAGISKDDANRCEHIARIEEPLFQAYIDEKREKREPVSITDVIKAVVSGQKKKVKVVERPAMADALHTGDLADLESKGLKFGTIYADPPWQYDSTGSRGAAAKHYSTMSVDDIAALPVGALAEENAHLHLWTTSNFLFEAKKVMEAWGFEYKSLFVWVKPQMGTGSYWRVANEFLLLGTRGSCAFKDKGLRSWGEFDRRAHSQKPEEVRSMIERASPGHRLELFGRARADGWVVWGNEAPRSDFAANVDSFFGKTSEDDDPPTDFGGLQAA